MSSDRPLTKLSQLLIRQLSHGLTDGEHALLKDWLAEDTEARQYYVEFMALNAQLRKQHVAAVASPNLDFNFGEGHPDVTEALAGLLEETGPEHEAQDSEHADEIRRIAEQRLQAFLAEQDQLRREQASNQRYQATSSLPEDLYHIAEKISAAATWALRKAVRVAVVAAVVLLGLVSVQYALRHRTVATLDEVVHARWNQPPTDANLHPGPMFLIEGFAKLTFKQGAEVILQAPCAFDLSSKNKMTLHRGMVTAQVPASATGFTIKTPQSTVTDFGTEFGVQVQDSAASEVHVFDGLVKIKTETQPQIHDVTEGKAAVMAGSGELNVSHMGNRPNLFVRDIPKANAFSIPNKRLDLADIVGGGSGFGTGRRHACINPVTGQTAHAYMSEQRTGRNGYVKVPSLPFVDGVFVPLAPGGLMPISTVGHHFAFPPSVGNWYVEPAHAGKADPQAFLALDGKTYGTVDRPALLMHANLGITFDLEAIRASQAGTRIRSFTSVCGISSHVRSNKTPDAIFYVLVDGQVRFYQKIQLPGDPAVNIRVELRQDERFLTLACLAGTANHGDWSLFGVPALELEGKLERTVASP